MIIEIDQPQAEILLGLIQGQPITPAEYRELIELEEILKDA